MSGDEEMRRYASAIIMLVVLCSLAVSGRAMISPPDDIPGIPSIPPQGHQSIRATVINEDPAHYTLDVRKFANIGVSEDAPTFAIYTSSSLPAKCGDFRGLTVPQWSPSKYKRSYDLRGQDKVMKALKGYHCVVLRNAPREQ